MNRTIKRLFSLLLVLSVFLAGMGAAIPRARAEEAANDAYVLSYNGSVEGYAYSSMPYMYKSPFQMRHSYNDPAAGPNSVWTYTYTNEIFQLINTAKIASGGEGAYASIPVYCTDADTGTRNNTNYRRINLEDSSYHSSGAAARLRSVILSSFPYIQDIELIAQQANVWLAANGMPLLTDLQTGEAMLATQQAIWEITHGEKYSVEDHYIGCDSYDGSGAVYQTNSGEAETEYTESNIGSLYAYLLALEGRGPVRDAASEFSFENVRYSAGKEEDGSYTVSVSFYVNTQVNAGDSMTLSASCNGQTQSVELTDSGEYRFVFRELEDRKEVKLEINGVQTGGDVYLFDAVGERGASQSMIGYDSSTLPVHGEVLVTPDRLLNIVKTTGEAEGKKPLANIEFEIYRVATLAQLERGDVILGEKPTAEQISQFSREENRIAVLKTDVQGYAGYNFTANNQPDGVYMIVERFNPSTTGTIEPFFVIIPGTTEDGSGNVYTVSVSPKNNTETGPDIKKDVTQIENNSDSYDAGQLHTWILRGGVPAGIGSAQKYIISDVLDHRLTYSQGSPEVKLFTKSGEELPMTAVFHYVLKEGKVGTVDTFSVSLTAEGMAYVADNLGSGTQLPEIRVYYQASINADASMGEQIPNQAHVEYKNSAGMEYEADSDIPEVHTGGIPLLKQDVNGNALAGAEFRIARKATEEEIEDANISTEKLTIDGEVFDVVFVAFYPQEEFSGEKVQRVETDADGKAWFAGLAYGTYYIVETRAPAGYNLLTEPVEVVIDEESHLITEERDPTVRVVNTKFVLPETGGTGTTMFTVIGILIVGSAGMLLLMNSRKKRS